MFHDRCICSLEIKLEKYKKIIISPLIIIKNMIIEYIQLIFHRDIFRQIKDVYIIIIIIIIIGCEIKFININISKSIISKYNNKLKFKSFSILSYQNIVSRILILEINGINKFVYYSDLVNKLM